MRGRRQGQSPGVPERSERRGPERVTRNDRNGPDLAFRPCQHVPGGEDSNVTSHAVATGTSSAVSFRRRLCGWPVVCTCGVHLCLWCAARLLPSGPAAPRAAGCGRAARGGSASRCVSGGVGVARRGSALPCIHQGCVAAAHRSPLGTVEDDAPASTATTPTRLHCGPRLCVDPVGLC